MLCEQHASLVSDAKDHMLEIPPHLVGGLRRYLELGMEPGHFLRAVIENNLREAVGRCSGDDHDVGQTLRALCQWFYTWAPSECWGSKEKRIKWQADVSKLVKETRPDA